MSEEKKDEVLGQEKELDESELDAVTGAANCFCYLAGGGTSKENAGCGCVLGGGGKDSEGTCVCVAAGSGGRPGGDPVVAIPNPCPEGGDMLHHK